MASKKSLKMNKTLKAFEIIKRLKRRFMVTVHFGRFYHVDVICYPVFSVSESHREFLRAVIKAEKRALKEYEEHKKHGKVLRGVDPQIETYWRNQKEKTK